MTDDHVAVCFSCGWARAARSLGAARKRAESHGFDDCPTTVLSEEAVAQAQSIQRGDLIAMDADTARAIGHSLADAETRMQQARERYEGQL